LAGIWSCGDYPDIIGRLGSGVKRFMNNVKWV